LCNLLCILKVSFHALSPAFSLVNYTITQGGKGVILPPSVDAFGDHFEKWTNLEYRSFVTPTS
jgi:hypothetical protein